MQPTFLVIGAQKCGTTWLARMISQHPQVAVAAQKELHFFDKADAYAKGLGWYEQQFPPRSGAKAVGEFTPNYFWTTSDGMADRDLPKMVADAYPDLTLIVSLRNPVDRAISAYYHHLAQGRVSARQSLSDAADVHGITTMGFYDVHLRNWRRSFDASRFLIFIFEEDLRDERKAATVRQAFRHIGVDETFEPVDLLARYNVRRSDFNLRTRHTHPLLRRLLERLPERVKTSRMWDIAVQEEEKQRLAEIFEPHNRELERMIGREVPWGSRQ